MMNLSSTPAPIRGARFFFLLALFLALSLDAPWFGPSSVLAYLPTFSIAARKGTLGASQMARMRLFGSSNNEDAFIGTNGMDDDDEIFTPTTSNADETNASNNYLDDLTPPPVNFARNSILFSEQPSTKLRNNPALTTWRGARTYLPAVLTGAWPWRDLDMLDERPLAALYNALFVRLPVCAVAASYLYQKIALSHDLVIDLGFDASGPQAVPPLLVIGVLVLILL